MVSYVIEEINSIEGNPDELSELLVNVVEDGASIGFLPPLKLSDAKRIPNYTKSADGELDATIYFYKNI